MDSISFGHYGKRRVWMLLTLAALSVSILVMASMQPRTQPIGMALVALFVAFFSASFDIAADAYRTDSLSETERGLGSAYYVFAYRIGNLISGGVALFLASAIGWANTYHVMAGLLCLLLIPVYFAESPDESSFVSQPFFVTAYAALTNLLSRDKIAWYIAFIALYKFGDALALSLMTNFLLSTLQFSLKEIGVAYKFVGFFATISGAFLGGIILLRQPLFTGLVIFGLLQAISNLFFAILAYVGHHLWLMGSAIFIENFCGGLSTAALMALLMSLCDKRFSATQFAMLSAIASLGRVLSGIPAAFLVDFLGWTSFFVWTAILSILPLFLLFNVRREMDAGQYAIIKS
jgi:PAT family beta-lactamase induction signal transducer AmpG